MMDKIFILFFLTCSMCVVSDAFSSEMNICISATSLAEKMRHIPLGLLSAIALTESGRHINGRITAWPWTITVNGIGHYYASKEQAMRAAFLFQKKGVTSMDVGCLQVNIKYHAKDFESFSEMFDPVHNVAYGAAYLLRLKEKHTSWKKAVEFYHSSNVVQQKKYYAKVMRNKRILNLLYRRYGAFSRKTLLHDNHKIGIIIMTHGKYRVPLHAPLKNIFDLNKFDSQKIFPPSIE